MSEPTTVSRRTLAAGAAWSLPVIAAAAATPAYAASPSCDQVSADWITQGTGNSTARASNGVLATTTANGQTRLRSPNFSTETVSNGVKNGIYLTLEQSGVNSAGQTVTITCPQPVHCLSFYINDFDTQYMAGNNKYSYEVSVPGFTAAAVQQSSANLAISGGTVKPVRDASSSAVGEDLANLTCNRGLARFAAVGPLSSFSLTYRNVIGNSRTSLAQNIQQVYISGMTYKLGANCPCS